jgi:O-antigen biosynthesis protein
MKFLILNHFIQSFTGSEINAVQLSLALKAMGHEADIATFTYGPPLRNVVETNNIKVIELLTDDRSLLKYDVIWAHHAPVLTHLLFKWNISHCRILFSSLSTFAPLESPPVYVNDIHCYLSHNLINTACLTRNGVPAERIHYFPNYAPERFFSYHKKNEFHNPLRIAVVSNHPVPELRNFAEIVRQKGHNVDFIGYMDHPIFVDDVMLIQYDLVITIGKTVRYCFALKIPVYCYDHFGGPGYIDDENYELAKNHNFSGRGFNRQLTRERLCRDIMSRFAAARNNLELLYDKAKQHFCLETNLTKLLEKIPDIPVTDIESLKRNNSLAARMNDTYIDQLKHGLHLQNLLVSVHPESPDLNVNVTDL